MQETLMSKLLDGQDKIHDKLTIVGERMARVEQTVQRHDEVTFPEMKGELAKQSDALLRMESKQNADMIYFVDEKERVFNDLNGRLEKVEADLKTRQDNKKEVKSKVSHIIWGGVEKIIYIIIGGGAVLWAALKAKLGN